MGVNVFYKGFCRVFQKAMWCAMWLLPWRTPEMISGEGSLEKLPAFCKKMGWHKVMLVTDKTILSLGLVDHLVEGMKAVDMDGEIFSDVVPNPTIQNIEDGVKFYYENKCDHIVALGGGSVIDCAKGIGARIARPKKSVEKMKGVLKILKKLPPLIAVPTTSGTGSEATLAAVISNPDKHEKYPINDPSLIPHYAVMDPLLTIGLPKGLTATTGMDALTHAVEAYIGGENTRQTKRQAVEATVLIFKYLKRAYDDGHDKEARNEMQHASYLAGCAFTRAYVGYVHAVAHTLGGQYGVPHGLANAILLPHVLEAYGKKAHKKLAKLADAVGITGKDNAEKANGFIKAIKDMNAYMEIPEKLPAPWKIEEEDLPIMIEHALSEANPLYPCPDVWGEKEIKAMYDKIR